MYDLATALKFGNRNFLSLDLYERIFCHNALATYK